MIRFPETAHEVTRKLKSRKNSLLFTVTACQLIVFGFVALNGGSSVSSKQLFEEVFNRP
jgi:ammonia channel protein AmtB